MIIRPKARLQSQTSIMQFLLSVLLILLTFAQAWVNVHPSSSSSSHHMQSFTARLNRLHSSGRVSSILRVGSSTLDMERVDSTSDDDDNDIVLGEDGIYQIENEQQHQTFMEANKDKLVVMKVFAPWCRACKGLEPKFVQIVHDPKFADLPIKFCQLSIQHNKAFVKELGVLALPTIQFYVAGTLADNFPCGPSKVPILKRKLATLINDHVDSETRLLKESSILNATESVAALTTHKDDEATGSVGAARFIESAKANIEAHVEALAAKDAASTQVDMASLNMSEAAKMELVRNIPYFNDLSLADLDVVLSRAKQLTYDAGTVLMRQGRRGRTFYILTQGEVEVMIQQDAGLDPLVSPNPRYMGAVINRLGPGDYFGERALITGEPRAASIRATETVTVWAFDKDDFPASSVLSGRTLYTTELSGMNDKYGVSLNDLYNTEVDRQITQSSLASMKRGSVNTPDVIRGVDTDEEITDDDESVAEIAADETITQVSAVQPTALQTDAIFALLTRFQMIRHVSQCYDYIINMRAVWGDEVSIRRSMLVNRLSAAQRTEFSETFKLIDRNGDGTITLLELKRVMESIGEGKSDSELRDMIDQSGADSKINGESVLSISDFMGIMAEAEFFSLFKDIFSSLDKQDSGFVKASELDRVLCGVRDLISDDRKSIIDVDDMEMLIDYEQFTRMMLGSALL
ncbi:hypothetical protein MPSEU_000360200 [Mayamaea pseudoterrestris]|nr:hypothetical protein MPSEU_000360200 [Mayamaea pseudoterrestris]